MRKLIKNKLDTLKANKEYWIERLTTIDKEIAELQYDYDNFGTIMMENFALSKKTDRIVDVFTNNLILFVRDGIEHLAFIDSNNKQRIMPKERWDEINKDDPLSQCCNASISYLEPCDDCKEKEQECKLSTNGTCSDCGELNDE